jgi:hypothetical protein
MPEAREAETLTCTPEVHPAEKNTFLKIVGACNCLLISVTVTRILIVIVAATTSPFIPENVFVMDFWTCYIIYISS